MWTKRTKARQAARTALRAEATTALVGDGADGQQGLDPACFPRVFGGTSVLVFRTTPAGRYTYVSPNVRVILGYEPEELFAQHPMQTLHPDDLTRIATALDLLAAGSVRETVLLRKRHSAGHHVWLEAQIAPIRDPDSHEVLEMEVTARDVTVHVTTERALRQRTGAEAPVAASDTWPVIEQVIATRAFQPVFQPVADLPTGNVVGFEALTRFDDGTPPDVRFKEAATLGIGVPLEQATVQAAIDAAAKLPPGLFLSVNVSPALILDHEAVALAARAGSRTLVLELTERDPVDDYHALARVLEGFERVELAVDDAGAGYSSLRHILALHPAYIKLDITLVRGVDDDTARQALVAGIHQFAMLTNCCTVAEGVETEAEADALRRLGIQFGQGFLFGQPVPVDRIASV
jgi:PAS domain S-box-containing protein